MAKLYSFNGGAEGGTLESVAIPGNNKPCQRDVAGFPHEISEKLIQEKAMAETTWENKVTININTNQYHLVVVLNRLPNPTYNDNMKYF